MFLLCNKQYILSLQRTDKVETGNLSFTLEELSPRRKTFFGLQHESSKFSTASMSLPVTNTLCHFGSSQAFDWLFSTLPLTGFLTVQNSRSVISFAFSVVQQLKALLVFQWEERTLLFGLVKDLDDKF